MLACMVCGEALLSRNASSSRASAGADAVRSRSGKQELKLARHCCAMPLELGVERLPALRLHREAQTLPGGVPQAGVGLLVVEHLQAILEAAQVQIGVLELLDCLRGQQLLPGEQR